MKLSELNLEQELPLNHTKNLILAMFEPFNF